MRIIAVDYDGTISCAPPVFRAIMATLDACYKVIVVTSRDDTPGNRAEITAAVGVYPIVFCGSLAKYPALKRAGYELLFCIDDQPEAWLPFPEPNWLVRLVGGAKWLWHKLIGY